MEKIQKPIKRYAPVTLGFGEVFQGQHHKGIDFGVPEGTPVYSAAAGTVLQSGWDGKGYGWYMILIHPDGSGSVYAHLCKKGLDIGASVTAGVIIGYSGNSGNSTGPHLHFEYRRQAAYQHTVVNPADYFVQEQSYDQTVPQQSYDVPLPGLKDNLKVGAAEIVCGSANVRDKDMRVIGQVPRGTKVTLTGEVKDYNGYKYYRSLIVRDVWIAACDEYTQILDNK